VFALGLSRYLPTLFSIPVILLEPVKMIAAYLAATGQLLWAAVTFVVGELLKLVLVERLFELTKNKLMKIPNICLGLSSLRAGKGLGNANGGVESLSIVEQVNPGSHQRSAGRGISSRRLASIAAANAW
jgi:hypothetical protein